MKNHACSAQRSPIYFIENGDDDYPTDGTLLPDGLCALPHLTPPAQISFLLEN